MVEKMNFRFTKEHPYVIFCEGRDERQWLIAYLAYLSSYKVVPDQVEVHDLGGNEQMLNAIKSIPRLDHYNEIKAILFIRDAEKNHQSAIQALSEKILHNFPIADNPSSLRGGVWYPTEDHVQIGFTLFPGQTASGDFFDGTLEDLCLSILKTQDEKLPASTLCELGDTYLEEIQKARGIPLKEIQKVKSASFHTYHKNRLHTYFSGTNKFVGMKVGEAARAGCFDFSSYHLNYLKKLLIDMSH